MRKSLLAGLAAAALLAAPSLAVAQTDEPAGGENWISLGFVSIPNSAPLTSFDISWVDTDLNLYFLADRSNAGIDLFGMVVNPGIFTVKPTAPNNFTGNVPTCVIPNACNGPNGIITLINAGTSGKELWAGDGPQNNPVCGGGGTICSTVKVFNSAPVLTHVISTQGAFRADELCVATVTPTTTGGPANKGNGGAHALVMIANDSDTPPFISWIPTDGTFAYQVIAQLRFPTATNGIEQCQFDPRTKEVYLNLPEVSGPGNDTTAGATVAMDPQDVTLNGAAAATFRKVDLTKCAGPQGMAIIDSTPNNILLGCNAPTPNPGEVSPGPFTGLNNSVIINNMSGVVTTTLPGQGGADQVWWEPGSNHYFIASGSLLPAQFLGINDAATNAVDVNIFVGTTGATTRRSHSVAAWSGNTLGLPTSVAAVFLPVSAVGGSATAPFSSILCGPAGSSTAAQGCIAVFAALPIPTGDKSDTD